MPSKSTAVSTAAGKGPPPRRPLPAPGSGGAWLLAARLPTLGAAIVPVAVGTACAHALGGVRPLAALCALIGAIAIQIGTNFANDVFDYQKGADTAARLGPPRAAQLGLLTPGALYAGIGVAFAVAFAAGVYLVAIGGWPIVIIGLASLLSGLAYTGGPYPLGYHGLGDLFVMAFFGFVAVGGTTFVQLDRVPALAWWAALPVGALATAILVVNNVRDRETDVLAGKRTLAVRLGRRGALAEYLGCMLLAYAVPIGLAASGLAGPLVLLPLLTVPVGVRRFNALGAAVGAEHNPVLVGTAKLLVLYGGLFAAGIALAPR
jgi:1,4-dihydroxy-2-naphthoate octaprenyltransferase